MANGLICTANCYSVHATVRRPNPTERIAGEMMADSGSCLNCSLPWRSWTLQAFAAVRRTIIRRQAQRAQPVEVARRDRWLGGFHYGSRNHRLMIGLAGLCRAFSR